MRYITDVIIRFLFLALAVFALNIQNADARSIIRDAEIEGTLREWITPLAQSAGLSPNAINIILVQDDRVNAFVAGGPNIFLHTGLINKTKTPEELIGVMAHELGHIQGGHLLAIKGASERAGFESILGAVIGIGAAVLSGQGELGSAVIAGSQGLAASRFLSFSRVHESAADQAAIRLTTDAKIDPRGIVSFLDTLGAQELLPTSQQVEYVRTHPLTGNRIEAVTQKANAAPRYPTPDGWHKQHARMKAKLLGYIKPQSVEWAYNVNDQSTDAVYARAIAAYRMGKPDRAMRLIDDLINREPQNPYFHELKGQTAVDFGRLKTGIRSYETALSLKPEAALIRIALAHAMIENGGDLDMIIDHLNRAQTQEPRSAQVYRLLATAYGKQGNETLSRLNLAEEAVLRRNYGYARQQAALVTQDKSASQREKLQASDILNYVEYAVRKK